MRVLITGINGAAGSYLAEHLRTIGINPCGISREECDLMDYKSTAARLLFLRPEVIYHLAAHANVREAFDKPAEVFTNNTVGAINLFEAIRRLKLDPLVMVASSSEVYGNPKEYPIAETCAYHPSNPYAVSKLSEDFLAQMYGRDYGMKVVITRGFSYVNPRRRDLALSSFARQIVKIERGEQFEIEHGNLDSVRAFCDVRDVVKAFAMTPGLPSVTKENDESGIYNIGGSEPVSIGQCLDMLIEMATVPIVRRQNPALMRPTDVTNQIPNCSRFMALTGWKPLIPLRESLEWLLHHYRTA